MTNEPSAARFEGGLYAVPRSTRAIKELAAARGYAWIDLDLTGARNKSAFLECCRSALGLPEHFGANWDALNDCIQDLSWRPAQGYVLALSHGAEFVRNSPEEHATALEIMADAAEYWSAHGKPFVVLLDGQTRGDMKLNPLPAR